MTKQTKTELELPEFDIKFVKLNFSHIHKVMNELYLSDIDIIKMIEASYNDEKILKNLEKKLFIKKNHILIRNASDFAAELIQSFFRLKLSIKLTNELDFVERKDKLERIGYYRENFYNEFSLFTGRLIKYFGKLKNDIDLKEYKNDLLKLRDKSYEKFDEINKSRNEHIHDRREAGLSHQRAAISDIYEKGIAGLYFPGFDEMFEKLKKENIETMLNDLIFLREETNIILDDFSTNIYMKIINKVY